MDEAIVKLINLVAQTAPHIWEAAMRQAIVHGVQRVLWGALFVGAAILLGRASRAAWVNAKQMRQQFRESQTRSRAEEMAADDAEMIAMVGATLTVGAVFFAVLQWMDAISILANPSFEAIRILSTMVVR